MPSPTRCRRAAVLLVAAMLLAPVACFEHGSEPSVVVRQPVNPALQPVQRRDAMAVQRATWLRNRPGRDEIEIVFLGDSITQRFESDGLAAWQAHFAPLGAASFGVNGDRTQHLLWRLETGLLDGVRPRGVVLLIGTNNTLDQSVGQIVEAVLAIVDTLVRQLPESRLLVLGLLPKAATADDPARLPIAVINSALASALATRPVRFLDVGDLLLSSDGTLPPAISPDALHLSAEGYARFADAIGPAVEALRE